MTEGLAPEVALPEIQEEFVFLVDDDEETLTEIDRFLRMAGFRVLPYSDPEEALRAFQEHNPRVLVTDQGMPEIKGLDLAVAAQEVDPDVQVVLMTASGGESAAQAALRIGAADYLRKPLDLEELARVVQRAFMVYARNEYTRSMQSWLRSEVERQTKVIRDVSLGALISLVRALEARSPHFVGHSQRVARCASRMALAMDLPKSHAEVIYNAGLLHDVGMISVPDDVVQKPTELSEDEARIVHGHCEKGLEILEPLGHLGAARRFILEHHERLDGSGYPHGKSGDDISLGGQMVAAAEAWTALTEERAYRTAMPKEQAMETLTAASGRWFSPATIQALRAAVSTS